MAMSQPQVTRTHAYICKCITSKSAQQQQNSSIIALNSTMSNLPVALLLDDRDT